MAVEAVLLNQSLFLQNKSDLHLHAIFHFGNSAVGTDHFGEHLCSVEVGGVWYLTHPTNLISLGGVSGTIAPARELPDVGSGGLNPDSPMRVILANLNLVVPVVSAMLVIIVAIIVMCFLRGKGDHIKGT